MHKVLIVGPSWVGDMMMAQPLFQLLRDQYPKMQLDVLAPAWSFPLLERMPQVSNAIDLPFSHGELKLKKRYQFAKKLRSTQYDQCIVLPNSLKSALIPYWAKIPSRTGWKGEHRYGLLNDIRHLNKAALPKMVQRFAALAFDKQNSVPSSLPQPQLQVPVSQRDHALKLHQLTISDRPILALCPGAEFGSSKQWPESYYAQVANALLGQGWDVWIFGSKNDASVASRICAQTQYRSKNLVGKTQLAEAIDLLSFASVVLTNDSGLMHIAAALDKSVVAVYGSTSPDFTPPFSDKAVIVQANNILSCRPCFKRECPLQHHDCMKEIFPNQILKIIAKTHLPLNPVAPTNVVT